MRKQSHKRPSKLSSVLWGLVFSVITGSNTVFADDLAVFTDNQAGVKPNMFFILDVSGSMNSRTPTGRRITDVHEAMRGVLANNIGRINVGYAWYHHRENPPAFTVDELTDSRSRTMISQINRLTAGGGTSSTLALAEAIKYLKGASNDPSSPVGQQCSQSVVVMVSDGQPNERKPVDPSPFGFNYDSCSTHLGGRCSPEIASYAANTNMNPGVANSNVISYTIGFSAPPLGEAYLENLANHGQGKFFAVSSQSALKAALDEIIGEVYGGAESFSEPTINIDNKTFSHDNRVFFPLFKPGRSNNWSGNIKGYFRAVGGDLVDTLGRPATELGDNGLQFAEDSRSFWSDDVDGNEVELGGVNSTLDAANRRIYTYTGGAIPNGGAAIATGENEISLGNGRLNEGYMGLSNRNESITWLREAPLGNALHSQLQIVNYDRGSVVFGITNHGLLHAFDAATPTNMNDHGGGNELFAFMPPELLKNLPRLASGGPSSEFVYGLDGAISRWHDDHNGDGVVNGRDTLTLIIGMRRGGNAYYAVDVTNPASPRYLWKIEGGVTPGFDDLAQSWSRMSLVKVKDSSAPSTPLLEAGTQKVLMFAGGYDPSLDDGDKRRRARGGSIYMVDKKGRLIWKTESDMDYSMPADLRILDTDGDGLADRTYAADLGGQIWRVDFDNIRNSGDFHVSRLADLGSRGGKPFFSPPSVVMPSTNNGEFMSVAIGSGDRDDPMNESKGGSFFVVNDYNVAKGPAPRGTPTITSDQLADVTGYSGSSNRSAVDAAKGWVLNLGRAEKSLTNVVVVEDKLLATTFSSEGRRTDSRGCDYTATAAYFYALDIRTGDPVLQLDGSDHNLNTADRRSQIDTVGIPSAPTIVTNPDNVELQIMVNRETAATIQPNVHHVYWHPK